MRHQEMKYNTEKDTLTMVRMSGLRSLSRYVRVLWHRRSEGTNEPLWGDNG